VAERAPFHRLDSHLTSGANFLELLKNSRVAQLARFEAFHRKHYSRNFNDLRDRGWLNDRLSEIENRADRVFHRYP